MSDVNFVMLFRTGAAFLVGGLVAVVARATEPLPGQIEFNRDVRPILSDLCFKCHGPDGRQRKGDLRLDIPDGTRVLVPKHPERSELYRRITADDPSERMPPASSGRRLSTRQIDLLRRWVEQGAAWQKHWSLISPTRPSFPAVRRADWVRNPIDAFVLARLEKEGLAPSPEAERTTLIRRVTLDLTGLPPTRAEVDAFLADSSPDAYEKVVDRLLASPRYGERLAIRWLDAARYADTNGYQSDGERFMWRWRDWVIDAFNRNQPFDQCTIEQIAGDLLPGATLPQKIATGFNRNHRGNGEGGIIPEEYAVEYVVDRVETTATVWLGLTLGCARCHDHKFDPFTQKEFYRLFAYFNNVPENGRAIKFGNSPPMLPSPTEDQQRQLRILERQLAAAEANIDRLEPELSASLCRWERSVRASPPNDWSIERALVAQYSVGSRPIAEALKVGDFGFYDKFSLGASVRAEGERGGTILSRMADVPHGEGYSVMLNNGKVQVYLTKRWLDDALRVETAGRLTPDQSRHILVTYDGSRVAAGVQVYIDGRPQKLKVLLDELNQSFQTRQPFHIGAGGGPAGLFRGRIDNVRVYTDVLTAEEAEIVACPDAIGDILAIAPETRTGVQRRKLRAYFLVHAAPEAIRQAWQRAVALRRQRDRLVETFPTTMVMEEMAGPRETFVLIRGQYDKHGEKVSPGVPASLPPLPRGVPSNRLSLARWLVDPSNPLTARVAVNRFWEMYFGTGLVKTANDFGVQGEWPSHPELLDYLATEFVLTGWDVKALQRRIVTSATYRQSSRVTPELLRRDPDNRLLARGPRYRLSAELIRDQALAASGLLVEHVGGPSVKPYQPAGIWKELADSVYPQDHGARLYRRSLYTFWKRTVAPTEMIAFDAPSREACTVRRSRTNTPLQALTLLNDVAFVEAARVLAQRLMREAGPTPEERLTRAFRLVTARRPRPAELQVLADGFRAQLLRFRHQPEAAMRLVSEGEFPRDAKLDVCELAAYTALANLILNLDEAVTKE
jgi:hypothetical protein